MGKLEERLLLSSCLRFETVIYSFTHVTRNFLVTTDDVLSFGYINRIETSFYASLCEVKSYI